MMTEAQGVSRRLIYLVPRPPAQEGAPWPIIPHYTMHQWPPVLLKAQTDPKHGRKLSCIFPLPFLLPFFCFWVCSVAIKCIAPQKDSKKLLKKQRAEEVLATARKYHLSPTARRLPRGRLLLPDTLFPSSHQRGWRHLGVLEVAFKAVALGHWRAGSCHHPNLPASLLLPVSVRGQWRHSRTGGGGWELPEMPGTPPTPSCSATRRSSTRWAPPHGPATPTQPA